ncbi:C-type mannose receptor 2-like [Notothenia coriiceps]|uniref:C-type mannose receptor 2-like n=1 Tax=Notothenia coriiceps TaxID=8208 RepID=A0A6I9P133_9TELE|nr:PREDICTED: C-type mannose receptor 2-like [Notothenia coriiceps]
MNVCVSTGLSAVSSHAGRQYHFFYEKVTFDEAQRYCREKYTDLATVDSMEVVTLLNSMGGYVDVLAWIGLYDDVDSWSWSLSDTSFYKPGETEFRRWESGAPQNTSWKRCTKISSATGYWTESECSTLLSAVCFDVSGLNVTYIYTQAMTWNEAQSYCRTNHKDLASVRNEAENQQIRDQVGTNYWIGLSRESWKWSDRSDSSFRHWSDNEPDTTMKTCAAANFYKSGKWADAGCGWELQFICYRQPVSMQVIKVRLQKSNSDVDLNDRAFLDELLVKMKKEMRDKGLDDNIQLSWKKQADGQVFHKEEEKRDEL